ncbi:hypothetical protein ACFV9C_13460 [Kribbella sp. NPDC059898]|uniref:hypothetical protein n=1 Tax=Kribbella sp. NPDC059898 TaxID=3346995 RepID=UPI003663F607
MKLNRRLVGAIVGVVAAAGIAVPAIAQTSPKPSKPSELPSVAASAGLSESRLQAGLVAAKRAGGSTDAGIAAFAAAAHTSRATAERIVYSVFGIQGDRSLTGPVAAGALASRLGVPAAAAQRALDRIGALSREPDGVDLHSAGFAAVAHDLGVQPAQLAAALDAVKQSMAGK